ncbi:protealysin inhibitor emfourin [Streptomyces sp. NPDC059708]|uniref:protealysin inhibitor emfourin n=1 Tax=Streptomyces sp. NPDC059708 TaxID=3346916 RepID=UPI0036946475
MPSDGTDHHAVRRADAHGARVPGPPSPCRLTGGRAWEDGPGAGRPGGAAAWAAEREIDTAARRDAPQWEDLAHRAVASTADGFHYRITVDGRAIDLQDPYLSEDQRELIHGVLGEGA